MAIRLENIIQEYQARKAELDRQGVYFVREINDDEAERFSKALLIMSVERQYAHDRPITIFINSGGGSVGAGFAMIEMVGKVKRDYGVVIHTVITGYAYSMGAIVFQAGDRRLMGQFSTMMLHGASWMIAGRDDTIFKDYAKLSRMYKKLVGDLFARRTSLNDSDWWERFIYSGRDKFLSASECLELQLVDEVADLRLPEAAAPTA